MVVGIASAYDLTAGSAHTCGLTTEAPRLRCWGGNADGQLGDGTTTGRLTAVPVLLAPVPVAVTAGYQHTCATTGTGAKLYCWGDNSSGQLGDGSITDRPTPVYVRDPAADPLSDGTFPFDLAWAGGSSTCGLKSGALYCWGNDSAGQLGNADGFDDSQVYPGPVAHLPTSLVHSSRYVAIGQAHICAIRPAGVDGGTPNCWGAGGSGQLGDGTTANRPAPVLVAGRNGATPAKVDQIAAGAAHTVILQEGRVFAWGLNDVGQLGDGTTTGRTRLVAVRLT